MTRHTRSYPSVKSIDAWAFSDCHNLIDVVLCEGLERVGDGSFCNCSSLVCMQFPSSVKSIGETMANFISSHVDHELTQHLQELQQRFFTDQNNVNWQMLCEEFVKPLTAGGVMILFHRYHCLGL
jgi:hypothetical protein